MDADLFLWYCRSPKPRNSRQGSFPRSFFRVSFLTPLSRLSQSVESPLKWQTRVVACFPSTSKPGYAIGSIEGRIAYNVIPEQFSSETFSFKCHRKEPAPPRTNPPKPTMIYSVNSISFHRGYGTFASAGGDGVSRVVFSFLPPLSSSAVEREPPPN